MPSLVTTIIGLPIEQPRAYRRLRAIRERVYRTVGNLRVEILTSPEPTPFGQWDARAFRPITPGASWGRVFDCAWLRITGTVPAGLTLGTGPGDASLMLGIRGEGLVHDRTGEPIDSVSTAFQQGDLPHSGGQYRRVANVEAITQADGREHVEVYADVTYNGWILYEIGKPVFHGAHLAVRDETAYALYYATLTLVVLAGATEDAALRRDLRTALDVSWARFSAGDLQGARDALAASITAPSDSDFVYDAVGHGHLDMAWLWPLRETKRKAARTYIRALNTAERRDDVVYGTSQPQQMAWMKERHPALFERLRAAVAAGRIELQGSFWIEPDTNLPSGESLIRQAIIGRRFMQQEFGLADDDLRLCWLPDTFGYNGNLPQILRGTGMDWFQTIKLAWNTVNDFPNRTFRWQGIDGSEVLVHMPPEGDYNARGAADGLLKGIRQYPESDLNSALLVYGSGDGGGGPGEIHGELLDREATPAGIRGLPRVRRRSASDFFRELERRHVEDGAVEHVHRGELYLETHQGTYTTQGAIKRWNRVLQRGLHDVEALAVAAGVGSRVRDALEPVWRDVLLNQFHDIIPGSSIERVNREAVQTSERLDAVVGAEADALIAALPTAAPDPALNSAPVALNLAPVARSEWVRAAGAWALAEVGPYAAAALSPAPSSFPGLTQTADTMSNGILTLRFGESGEIVSCLDAAGGEHAGSGLNRLVLHRDPYVFPFNAWDINRNYLTKPSLMLKLVESSTAIDGPRLVRRHVLTGPRVRVEQTIVLEAGSQLVRFETWVDWHQRHRMLRAEFRPTHFGEQARCEIQFGHIQRPTTERNSVEAAQFEVCAHQWLSVEDAAGGFALLNDGKYGHRAKNGLVSLNLLRSPTYPDPTADRGEHRFTYAFRPFATDAPGASGGLADVIADGYRLNHPIRLADVAPFAPLAMTDHPGVIVETIKPAEAGSGAVLRLYESLGQTATTAVTTTIPHRTAVETDMLERPIAPAAHGQLDLSRLEFSPFQIRTIRLEP